MADQIIQMKLSDLRKLFKEVAATAPKPEYIPVADFMERFGKTANEVRYMRETTYPEIFKRVGGRWKINVQAFKEVA